jgi:hypothetical protein
MTDSATETIESLSRTCAFLKEKGDVESESILKVGGFLLAIVAELITLKKTLLQVAEAQGMDRGSVDRMMNRISEETKERSLLSTGESSPALAEVLDVLGVLKKYDSAAPVPLS